MIFFADDRVLIKVLRQEKWYGANSPDLNPVDYQIWGKLQERVYRSRNHDVDQLKLPLIGEWEHFQQVFVDEMIKQWHTRLRACIRAHRGHFEHRLLLCLIFVQMYTLTVVCLCGCL